ncbi:hypothetical protein PMAYCL1PPCAC_24591, partial [Pristionchus mayeri]
VHCNCCGVFPSPQNTTFCLSNCGHIYCKECVDKGRLSVKCGRCHAAAPKFITIDRNLSSDLQVLFKKISTLLVEHAEELQPSLQFQSNQSVLRIKGQQAQMKHQDVQLMELRSQVTMMHDEIQTLQQQRDERSRSRSRSRHSSHPRSSDVSELSSHQQTMSSVGSNETAFLDPFKTPLSGLKRFTTSTPKLLLPMGVPPKRSNNHMTSHSRMDHSSTAPSLTMEIDGEITGATPADRSRPTTKMHLPTTTPKMSSKMVVESDPLISKFSKAPLPKTPAPRKSQQSLSMAERLSSSRPRTPMKVVQQPEVTSSTTPGSKINSLRGSCGMPLANSQLKAPVPITPIRPAFGSKQPSSAGPAMQMAPLSGLKTPAPGAKKVSGVPRTMPAGLKVVHAAPPNISQPYR